MKGKNWGIPAKAYVKNYSASTGRDSNTGYDAAGNIVTDRVQTIPTVFNRTMKYDAAGRQVETFDPALHPCCEVDQTSTNHYEGNGWLVKSGGVSSVGSSATYNLRSTVLGGEAVGTINSSSGSSIVGWTFTAPVIGGKLTYSEPAGQYAVNFTRTGPEGLLEYSADQPGKAFDPRGADTGIDGPTGGDGSGGYPTSGPDTTNYGRCAEGGVPMPCDPQSRISMNFDRIQDAINNDNDKNKTTPKTGAGSSIVHESLHDSSSAQTTAQTGKSEPNPEKSGTVDPASVPDDGISGRIFGPANGESFVTVSDNTPMVDASQSQTESENMRNFNAAVRATRDILTGDNPCATFFGGAGLAGLNAILNAVTSQGESTFTDLGTGGLGIRMGISVANAAIPSRSSTLTGLDGSSTVVPGQFTNVSPSSVAINDRGLFVRRLPQSSISSDRLPNFGGYSPGTLESRVLQLLHEIGHLTITDVKSYFIPRGVSHISDQRNILTHLLPIDGGNESLSKKNTAAVTKACRKQIDAIR